MSIQPASYVVASSTRETTDAMTVTISEIRAELVLSSYSQVRTRGVESVQARFPSFAGTSPCIHSYPHLPTVATTRHFPDSRFQTSSAVSQTGSSCSEDADSISDHSLVRRHRASVHRSCWRIAPRLSSGRPCRHCRACGSSFAAEGRCLCHCTY